jgi:TP901 family phage tail tape measure protein
MATNKLKNEDLVLNIIVNGNSAQSEIGRLSRTMVDSKSKIAAAKNEMANLERQGRTNSARYQQLQQDVTRYNQILEASRTRMAEVRQSLRLEDQTRQDLIKTLRRLRREQDQAIPGTEQYRQYEAQIQAVSNRLNELRTQVGSTGGVLQSMTGRIKAFFTSWVGGALALGTVVSGIKKATDEFAAFDDKLSDVMKTTNLSKENVKALNAELEKIQTRTSQDDLLGLARISGKLGYTDINEIKQFVEANNQLVVALNEDLGGNVEETVNVIGKLVDIFKLKDSMTAEQAFLKVGSAINELGMASTANEGYIVEFTKRLSGIAPLTGLTIQQVMGLGATLDQLGQSEEVSSTALSKLFIKMASSAEIYTKYAGMKLTDFKKLLETDFMGAFVRVLEGVKKNSNGINELAATLGDLGEDGGRTIGVIGKLADNTKILTDQIALSNTAMAEGTSLTDEYNVKNENAAAKLEMARKEVDKFWRILGEELFPVITSGNSIIAIFLNILIETIKFIAGNIKAITALALAITTYYTVVMITTKWEAITLALKVSIRAVTLALALAYSLLTGNLGRAAAAQRLLNITMAANPIGAVAAAIVGLTALLVLYSGKLTAVQKAQEAVNKTNSEAKANTESERLRIQELIKTIQDDTRHRSLRLTAINQLRSLMPSVLKDYSDEAIMAGKATEAIENFTKAKLFEAKIKAKQANLDNVVAENEKYNQPQQKGFGYKVGSVVLGEMNMERFSGRSRDQYEDRISGLNIVLKDLMETEKAYEDWKTSVRIKPTDENNSPIVAQKDPKAADKAAREANKARIKELEEAKKAYQEKLKAEGLFQRDRNSLTSEELEKRAQITEDYIKKENEINSKYNHSQREQTNKDEAELDRRASIERKLRDKLLDKTDPLLQQENEAYKKRLQDAGLFGKKKEDLTAEQFSALEILQNNHQKNINKIDADAIAKHTDQTLSKNSEELADLRIKHNDELSEITTLAQAKEVLSTQLSGRELKTITSLSQARKLIRNQQDLEEKELQRKHLEEMLLILQETLASGKMEGINLSDSILSDEEKEKLNKKIRELKEELSKIKGTDNLDEVKENARSKVDILGMAIEDWENLFKNVGDTEEKLLRLYGALGAMTQVWSSYNNMVAAGENKKLQDDEQANKKKKSNLDDRLKAGTISQESYNNQVAKLDKDLEKKKSEVAYKQAKRERNVALMSAIVNTATAVTKALPNIFLSALVGAMGAFQIGTILKTPLPAIEGREEGGYLDVTRSQDGRQFRAKSNPNKRGFVSSPTVIVGENGLEWVANADATRNPQIKPFIDILDTAQRNGTISSLKMSDIIRSATPGRASGGYLAPSNIPTPIASIPTINNQSDPELIALIKEQSKVISSLNKILQNGVSVSLLGPNGFIEKKQELDNIQNNADL